MNAKNSWIVGASIAAGCLILAMTFGNPATGEITAPPTAVGRYQVSLKALDSNTVVFVFDSHTGRCWYRDTNTAGSPWTDLGSPLEPRAK